MSTKIFQYKFKKYFITYLKLQALISSGGLIMEMVKIEYLIPQILTKLK